MRFKTGAMAVAGALVLLLAGWAWLRPPRGPRVTGIGPEWKPQAYVWQRAWGEAVRSAVREHGPAFGRMVVLARQIEWRDGGGEGGGVIRVGLDWESLRKCGAAVGAGIRINPYHGSFDGTAADRICDAVRDVTAEAERAGVGLAEIQIDFDAATSQLPAYRAWLQKTRTVTHVPVTFTALPTWMESSAFPALARDAGYYVLQVHWLAPPKRLADPLVLCDIPAARRALERAARIGVPFRLALPTYGYLAAFHPDGSFAAIAAEDAPPGWGEGSPLRIVEAQPDELADFVAELQRDRPASLLGIIWYRLPLETDRRNWSWPTLNAVMNARQPLPPHLAAQCEQSDGLFDISLTNTGERDASLDHTAIHLSWTDAEKSAADGLQGFEPEPLSPTEMRFVCPADPSRRLKPGASLHAGWIRLTNKANLHVQLETITGNDPPPLPDGDR